jgi:polyferredoxin
MCVFRLWYSMLIVFAFGLILTLKSRKRNFCSDYCPMASIQDGVYKKRNNTNSAVSSFLKRTPVKIAFAVIFWSAVVLLMFLYFDNQSALWSAMLGIMLSSAGVAILAQSLSSKRIWCATVCPYGNVLSLLVKKRN